MIFSKNPKTLTVLSISFVILAISYDLWAKQTGGVTKLVSQQMSNLSTPTRSGLHPTNLAPTATLNQPINNSVVVHFSLHENGNGTNTGIPIESKDYRDIDDIIEKHCCELANVTSTPERCAPSSGARLVGDAGVRILSFNDIEDKQRVYCVVQGVHFVWPLVKVGHTVWPKNVVGPIPGLPIALKQLSNQPRVFSVENFVAPEEVEELLRVNKDRLTRSEVGFGGWQDDTRTSFTSWDFNSLAAIAIQKRTFEILGMDYQPEIADAMQVLRYTSDGFKGQGEWYKPHVDWFNSDGYDGNDPMISNGTNRMATMFLYLSDVEEGGCTIFPLSTSHEGYNGEKIVHEGTVNTPGYINTQEARAACNLTSTSLKSCPKQGNAVLFYSQGPDGTLDPYSLHGGCPPLNGGVKWSANVWIWNRERPDKSKAKDMPKDKQNQNMTPGSFHLSFRNSRNSHLDVYWDSDVNSGDENMNVAYQMNQERFKLQFELSGYVQRVITTYDSHRFIAVDRETKQVVFEYQARKPAEGEVYDDDEGQIVVI